MFKSSFAFLANFSHTAFTRKRRRLEEVFWCFFSHAVKCTHVPSSTFKVELSYWACLSTTLRKESHLARTAAGLSKLLWCMLRLMVNRAFITVFHSDQKCQISENVRKVLFLAAHWPKQSYKLHFTVGLSTFIFHLPKFEKNHHRLLFETNVTKVISKNVLVKSSEKTLFLSARKRQLALLVIIFVLFCPVCP